MQPLTSNPIRERMAAAFPGKDILIGETGWPSAGRMREGALPSLVNQALVLQEVLAVANRKGYRVNVIEAFDQPWKRRLEGTVGGYWGLLDDATRQAKFEWGRPVSNHPLWRQQAAAGVAFAALIFAMALWGGRRGETSLPRWVAVSAIALAGGITIGWAVELHDLRESRHRRLDSVGGFGRLGRSDPAGCGLRPDARWPAAIVCRRPDTAPAADGVRLRMDRRHAGRRDHV